MMPPGRLNRSDGKFPAGPAGAAGMTYGEFDL